MAERENKERSEKEKEYQKPELKKEGDLRDITAGSIGSAT